MPYYPPYPYRPSYGGGYYPSNGYNRPPNYNSGFQNNGNIYVNTGGAIARAAMATTTGTSTTTSRARQQQQWLQQGAQDQQPYHAGQAKPVGPERPEQAPAASHAGRRANDLHPMRLPATGKASRVMRARTSARPRRRTVAMRLRPAIPSLAQVRAPAGRTRRRRKSRVRTRARTRRTVRRQARCRPRATCRSPRRSRYRSLRRNPCQAAIAVTAPAMRSGRHQDPRHSRRR